MFGVESVKLPTTPANFAPSVPLIVTPKGLNTGPLGTVPDMGVAETRQAIAALNIQPEDTVLELGFGPGSAVQTACAVIGVQEASSSSETTTT